VPTKGLPPPVAQAVKATKNIAATVFLIILNIANSLIFELASRHHF